MPSIPASTSTTSTSRKRSRKDLAPSSNKESFLEKPIKKVNEEIQHEISSDDETLNFDIVDSFSSDDDDEDDGDFEEGIEEENEEDDAFSEDEELDELLREEGDDDEDEEEDDDDTAFMSSDSDSDSEEGDSVEYTNPTIPGILPRIKLPEIDPVYESDTSDEETLNTVGNIPMEWYDDYEHIGYDKDGNKIMKSEIGDSLDKFLDSMDNPDSWKSVFDKLHGKNIVLSPEDLAIIRRIQSQQLPTETDPDAPPIELYEKPVEIMPLSSAPEPKRRFVPSKWEAKRIMKIVRAIRKGWIIPDKSKAPPKPRWYDIWTGEAEEDDTPSKRLANHIAAPKLKLPGNEESYNPPAEYLFTPQEEQEWTEMDPSDRKTNFIPKKFDSLRRVPAYNTFIQERFERCLDLYLCPRVVKKRIDIDPNSLLPQLPNPQDLEPFPKGLAITYQGHEGRVRCMSVDPTGQWMASGGEDGTVRVWEVSTGRCLRVYQCGESSQDQVDESSNGEKITCLSWNPNKAVQVLAVAYGKTVGLLIPNVGTNEQVLESSEDLVSTTNRPESGGSNEIKSVEWSKYASEKYAMGWRTKLVFSKPISYLTWHRKGDYFATLSPDANNSSVLIHRCSTRLSQSPFKKSKGLIQRILFHPTKPFFFVATQRFVRVYNLQKQELTKKLLAGVKWISSLDVHPTGDNVLIGSYDKRVVWFDMDVGSTPYKTLRFNTHAVRNVSYHRRHPLFVTCSDDGSLQVFHGMVYSDLMQNPLIVPVKVLKAHTPVNGLGALWCEWHPTQPWVFSAGADGDVKLWT